MSKKIEVRTTPSEIVVEERAEGKSLKISGVAIRYDSWSDGLGWFREKFKSGAFSESIKRGDRVDAYFNHDRSNILASTDNGSLVLTDSDTELRYEATLPKTTTANDVHELIRSKLVKGTSIAFRVNGDGEEWGEDKDGYWRVVSDADLSQTSPEVTPAYSDTDVAVRSMEEFRSSQEPDEDNSYKISILRKRQELSEIDT